MRLAGQIPRRQNRGVLPIMMSARAFLAWLSFSVLLLAADQPSLRAVVSELRALQAQSPSAEQVAANWAKSLPSLVALLPTAPAADLPGAIQAFRDCPTRDGQAAVAFDALLAAVRARAQPLAGDASTLIEFGSWRTPGTVDFLAWVWKDVPAARQDAARALARIDVPAAADLLALEICTRPAASWSPKDRERLASLAPSPDLRRKIVEAIAASIGAPAASGAGGSPAEVLFQARPGLYRGMLADATIARLQAAAIGTGADPIASANAVSVLVATGSTAIDTWLREQGGALLVQLGKATDGRQAALRLANAAAILAWVGCPVRAGDVPAATAIGAAPMDARSGWWSLALRAAGGFAPAAVLVGWPSAADFEREIRLSPYGRARFGSPPAEGAGEPPPHVLNPAARSPIADAVLIGAYPAWIEGPASLQRVLEGSDVGARSRIAESLLRLGDQAARYKNVPGFAAWLEGASPRSLTPSDRARLIDRLGAGREAAIAVLIADVGARTAEHPWSPGVTLLAQWQPKHPELDGLKARLAGSPLPGARLAAWTLGALGGNGAALDADLIEGIANVEGFSDELAIWPAAAIAQVRTVRALGSADPQAARKLAYLLGALDARDPTEKKL